MRVTSIGYREWVEDAAWLATVHVLPHSRQRQNVVTVIVFATVSMILPVQKGQLVGRVTAQSSPDSDILPLSKSLSADTWVARGFVTRRECLVMAAVLTLRATTHRTDDPIHRSVHL